LPLRSGTRSRKPALTKLCDPLWEQGGRLVLACEESASVCLIRRVRMSMVIDLKA
jgi:hypothetical protein